MQAGFGNRRVTGSLVTGRVNKSTNWRRLAGGHGDCRLQCVGGMRDSGGKRPLDGGVGPCSRAWCNKN